ncbi:MAG TPA: lipoate--protein ligase, partial [Bacteroidales bacterium]|nr:lipoate--protein ligase [Bacteroidales bacterium]
MLCHNLPSTDPFFNLAAEEYLFRNRTEDFLILSINDPSVIIGKHQVAHRESDTRFVTQGNIPVIRRISGGGTVYHDHGNVNFCFILNSTGGTQVDFRKYTQPVIEFLGSLKIKAVLEGKNDLKADGLKISGNAEHIYGKRVLHHGTLLFDADLERLRRSLRKDTSGYVTKAIASNPSHVTNIKGRTFGIGDAREFKEKMLEYFLGAEGNTKAHLTTVEEKLINSLADTRYHTWEWNYGYGPEYVLNNSFEIGNCNYTCNISVKGGIIREFELEGSGPLAQNGINFSGTRHMPEDLLRAFHQKKINISGEDIF